MKWFDNHSYEWRGFWLGRWEIFYSKRWMTHVCLNWYDVWKCMNFSFAFFWKQVQIDLHFIVILISWNNSTFKFLFTFPNHFFGLISLLTKLSLIISFETLFEWHAWNCQGLEKAWMRWWRLSRKLPQFELVSWHKMCWAFPSYWWYAGNDRDFKNLPLVWEPRMVLLCKNVFNFFLFTIFFNFDLLYPFSNFCFSFFFSWYNHIISFFFLFDIFVMVNYQSDETNANIISTLLNLNVRVTLV